MAKKISSRIPARRKSNKRQPLKATRPVRIDRHTTNTNGGKTAVHIGDITINGNAFNQINI